MSPRSESRFSRLFRHFRRLRIPTNTLHFSPPFISVARPPLLTDRFYRSVVVGFGAEWVCVAAPSYHVGSLPFQLRVSSLQRCKIYMAFQTRGSATLVSKFNIHTAVLFLRLTLSPMQGPSEPLDAGHHAHGTTPYINELGAHDWSPVSSYL